MSLKSSTTVMPTQKASIGRLVLGSALMLFLELALVRWLGSNVVHLSYFSNFVLLGSFLGIGAGFSSRNGSGRWSRSRPSCWRSSSSWSRGSP